VVATVNDEARSAGLMVGRGEGHVPLEVAAAVFGHLEPLLRSQQRSLSQYEVHSIAMQVRQVRLGLHVQREVGIDAGNPDEGVNNGEDLPP